MRSKNAVLVCIEVGSPFDVYIEYRLERMVLDRKIVHTIREYQHSHLRDDVKRNLRTILKEKFSEDLLLQICHIMGKREMERANFSDMLQYSYSDGIKLGKINPEYNFVYADDTLPKDVNRLCLVTGNTHYGVALAMHDGSLWRVQPLHDVEHITKDGIVKWMYCPIPEKGRI